MSNKYFIHKAYVSVSVYVQMGFLMAQMVKNLPAMQVTWVQFLSQKDSLEKDMATHSSILAWRIHGQRSLVGYGL